MKWGRSIRLWSVAAAVLLPANSVLAQPATVFIGEDHRCDGCGIRRVQVATITDREYAEGALAGAARVFVTSDTSFIVNAGSLVWTELFFADRTGKIRQRIGREGDGPGEYRFPWYVGEADDSRYVFDVQAHRVTQLTKDFSVLGTAPLPARPLGPPQVFSDGRYLLNATLPSTASRSDAAVLHIVGRGGDVVRSFGPSGESPTRVVAIAGDSAIFVASSHRYRIEMWDTTGVLRRVYERQVPWFPTRPSSGSVADGAPHIKQLKEVDGKLWVLIGSQRRLERDRGVRGLFWDQSLSQMRVEVLDLKQPSLVAALTVPRYYSSAAQGPGFYDASHRLSDLDEHQIVISTYHLVVPGR